ncbi:enoyl-CoA hydratase [Cytobacillus sp. Hm23]
MEYTKCHIANYVATVSLDHPPANAVSSLVLKELSKRLDDLEKNDDVRVILLQGEGRFFSAGADIKEFTTVESSEEFSVLSEAGQQLFERIELFSKPVIAAIHGAALGGGLELAMSCHIRIVTDNAKLGLPELQLGLIPGFAGTQRLPRYVGTAKAAELMLTSEPISGLEAVKLGLANHAFPEEVMLEEASKLALKIAAKSPISVSAVIELLKYTKADQYYSGVKREAELFGKVFATEDASEGISAFLEKRAPTFKGK